MSDTLFWDVDTQRDFCNEDGALYVPGAEEIKGNLARLTALSHEQGIQRVKTGDWHEMSDEEIDEEDPDLVETYPPHCMAGSDGAEFVPETLVVRTGATTFPPEAGELRRDASPASRAPDVFLRKTKFDVFEGCEYANDVLEAINPDRVFVYGVSGNVCVMHAITGLLSRGYDVVAVEDAVASLPAEGGLQSWEELVDAWEGRADKTEASFETATTQQVVEDLSR